jgi:CheY-like chemotaxis protein
LLRRLIGEDIDLRVVLAPDLGHVRADPGQLDQILLNLAVNARDAMPTGGSLTIETRNVHLDESYAQRFQEVRPGPYVMLAVTDTGCGMNEEVKARMFEPFFTTKGVGQGTGLGLATVFGVVKQSGGHIAVYSEPGKGTSFKIYMPRVEGEVRASGSHPGFAKIPGGTETILLVEDEDAVRRLGRLVLETNGYTVVEAGDGEQALRICEQYPDPIHLIVTDVIMPHIGGRELADRLLALLPTLKVLYLSGYTDDAIIRHGVLDSTMAFLQKPFTNMALARKVREVLDQ